MDLAEHLYKWSEDTLQEVDRLPADEVLAGDARELVERLAGSAELDRIEVDEDGAYTPGVEEAIVDGGNPARAGLLGPGATRATAAAM